MPRKDIFLVFSFLVRTLSAVGGCATSTSSLVMLTNTFESNMSPAVVCSILTMHVANKDIF